MKRIFLNSALLLLFVGITSLVPSTKVKYYSAEAKLSLTFPGEFKITEKEDESYKSVELQASVDDVIYFSNYTIHEVKMVDNEEMCKVSVNAFIDALEGVKTEEANWKVNKNSGLRASFKAPEMGAVGEYRVVIIGQIQYQITIIAPEGSWDEKKAKKFFKSFKIGK